MSGVRRAGAVLVLIAATALVVVGATSAAAPAKRATKKVDLQQDYFDPANLRIHKRDKVTWKFIAGSGGVHDVYVTDAPRGVKKSDFRSKDLFQDDTFTRRFKVRGQYHFICTFHPAMEMDVKVRR
jgi:plastocyanin